MKKFELYHGDCLRIIDKLDKVDAVITDPPYGLETEYSGDEDKLESYGEWIWSVISKAENKCNPGSPLFIWQSMLNIRKLASWFPRDWRLFAGCKNSLQESPRTMQYAFDPVLVWWTDGEKYSAGNSPKDWYIDDATNTLNTKNDSAKNHPSAKPLGQVRYIVNHWVPPDGTVLDPFMGSGTTGVAAMQTGRRFIGIEVDKEYFKIAKEYIEQAES